MSKLAFEDTQNSLRCVTNHQDFADVTKKAVLELAGPLFKPEMVEVIDAEEINQKMSMFCNHIYF